MAAQRPDHLSLADHWDAVPAEPLIVQQRAQRLLKNTTGFAISYYR
jgi:hypothetical protein